MRTILKELAAIFGGWDDDPQEPSKTAAGGQSPWPRVSRGGDGVARTAGAPDEHDLVPAAALARESAFNRLAMRIHAAQRATSPVLCRFWDASPGEPPAAWHEIPPVPAAAFRDTPIASGTPEAVFRTSGTTGGGGSRGEHHVISLALYRAAARRNYRRHLMGGGGPLRVLSLIPGPRAVPDSSLSAMAGFIAAERDVAGTTWAFDPESGVNAGAVREAAAAGEPVLVLTTAFALVHLLEAVDREPLRFPEGSRMMETGGFKGRTAEVDRGALYDRTEHALGIPVSSIVNEYGMTELLSQAYDGVAAGAPPLPVRVHRFPPWVRTRALNPATLAPLPPGEPGLLAHFDLANAGSVCHILTEDLGCTTEDGTLRLLGRARGAHLRGCSLAVESFVRATGLAR